MVTYTIIADPKVKDDLKEARDFLNSRKNYLNLSNFYFNNYFELCIHCRLYSKKE